MKEGDFQSNCILYWYHKTHTSEPTLQNQSQRPELDPTVLESSCNFSCLQFPNDIFVGDLFNVTATSLTTKSHISKNDPCLHIPFLQLSPRKVNQNRTANQRTTCQTVIHSGSLTAGTDKKNMFVASEFLAAFGSHSHISTLLSEKFV